MFKNITELKSQKITVAVNCTAAVISVLLLLVCLKDKILHFLASSANLRRICIFACRFALFLTWQARQMWIQPCQNQLASCSDFQPFTIFASRASGYIYTLREPLVNFVYEAKSRPWQRTAYFALISGMSRENEAGMSISSTKLKKMYTL